MSKDKFSIKDFYERFPDNDSCLEEIKTMKYPEGTKCPKCGRETKFYKVKDRTAYACQFCGTHVYPLAGTIFEKSTTDLKLWFYAMYLVVQTRSGISAKQLERELGVTYKTAWRMLNKIRSVMSEDDSEPLKGTVEVDETYIGGKGKNRRYVAHFNEKPKDVVFGMIERGGKAKLKHVPNTGKWTLLGEIESNIQPSSMVMSDELASYTSLAKMGYGHGVIKHSDTYVDGDIHTNNIEGMWSQLKRGIYGVYRKVSTKYLQNYADEYAFRYNYRHSEGKMFDVLLSKV